jgi:hypothetical protein
LVYDAFGGALASNVKEKPGKSEKSLKANQKSVEIQRLLPKNLVTHSDYVFTMLIEEKYLGRPGKALENSLENSDEVTSWKMKTE